MIEIDNPFIFGDLFPGIYVNYYEGTKEFLFLNHNNIIMYGEENGTWRFITIFDLSSWVLQQRFQSNLTLDEMRQKIMNLETELFNINLILKNSIKIDEADFAYLLLKYKE